MVNWNSTIVADAMTKTILIVDDATGVRRLVRMVLERAGYAVVEAEDVIAALAMLDQQSIAMAICDMHMPHMNGLDFVRAARIRRAYQFLPVLLLTGESQAAQMDEVKAAGIRACMSKPFSPTALLGAVTKLCPL